MQFWISTTNQVLIKSNVKTSDVEDYWQAKVQINLNFIDATMITKNKHNTRFYEAPWRILD